MRTRLYQTLLSSLFMVGVFCLVMAGVIFLTPSTTTSASVPASIGTPTPPPPPTPEPPTEIPAPATATPLPPSATPPPPTPTRTPRPKRDPHPDPRDDPIPTTQPSPTNTPEPWETDVEIVKYANKRDVAPGEIVVYSLVARNIGARTAFDVVVTDAVPQQLQVTDLASSKGDVVVEGQSVTAYPRTLEAGESVEIRITARVRPGTESGAIPNTGRITTSTPGDTPGNNTSTVRVTITARVTQLTIQRLPVTAEALDSPLVALPPWLPWLLVGLLLVALGVVLRLRGSGLSRVTATATPAAAPARPAHLVALAAEKKQLLTPAPPPSGAPAESLLPVQTTDAPPPAVLLPTARPPQPLSPIAQLDRPGALRWVQREDKKNG